MAGIAPVQTMRKPKGHKAAKPQEMKIKKTTNKVKSRKIPHKK